MCSGNSKGFKNYLPAAPSLKQALRTPGQQYKDIQVKTSADTVQHQPRDRDQLTYFTRMARESKKMGKDAIWALHELAFTIDGFVQSITTFPDLVCVIALKEAVEFADSISSSAPIIMSYDTNFNMGDFYLSCLTIQLPMFAEHPILPTAFVLHERKFGSVHEALFSYICPKLKSLHRVVVVTDGEVGIEKAITTCCPSWSTVGCWNHIIRDVEFWVKKHSGGSAEGMVYKSHVRELLMCATQAEYDLKLQSLRAAWTSAFDTYFETSLEKRVCASCVGSLRQYGIESDSITTNISESVNAVLKRFQEWNEVPCDEMVYGIYKLQIFYMSQVTRSADGFGPYTVDTDSECTHAAPSVPATDVAALFDDIKSKLQMHEHGTETVPNSVAAIGQEMMVTHVPAQQSFQVSLPNGNVHAVRLFPKQSCTCPATTTCSYICAVMRTVGLPLEQRKTLQLTELRRNVR